MHVATAGQGTETRAGEQVHGGAKGSVEGGFERRKVRAELPPRSGLSRERRSVCGRGADSAEGGAKGEPDQPHDRGQKE
eukprot:5075681-Pleurochrysis_carterae.AAC.2